MDSASVVPMPLSDVHCLDAWNFGMAPSVSFCRCMLCEGCVKSDSDSHQQVLEADATYSGVADCQDLCRALPYVHNIKGLCVASFVWHRESVCFSQVMEFKRKLFKIPYRQLLEDITQSLGWARPVYNGLNSLGGVASVVVCPKDEGPLAYFFEGKSSPAVAALEELAAEHAVFSLMENKRVLVLEFNFRKRGKNESCVGYYRDKKDRLSVPQRKRQLPTAGDYDGVATVDFRSVLDDVLTEYSVPITAVECVELSVARNVAFFGIQQASLKMEWVVSSCSTENLARESLAKKVLKYLQPFLGFEIEDLSYHQMRMAALQCSLERESYLTVKERTTRVMEEGGLGVLAIVDGCRTPVHEEAMNKIQNSPLPPLKKKRKTTPCQRRGSTDVCAKDCLYDLPDDLSTIFTVTIRM